MFTFLLIVITLLAILLIVMVLLQAGKGGGLAASFGGASSSMDSFMGGRQAATALTKGTWIGGSAFLVLALSLAVLSSRGTEVQESILRQNLPTGQTPPSLADLAAPALEAPAETTADEAGDESAPADGGSGAGEGTDPEGASDNGDN
ncbi:MAG: preprotein translocase subunit SecG [Gemmatimonadetes bacterium]|nr:preprotein translocase subunit SecG [Gemmatimonadota bacterium]